MSLQPSDAASPLVTILIPTYNRAASFLPGALSAACGQTYQNLDIFVSDNGSSDSTEAVVAAVADRRLRYHRHPQNLGPARNMNFCIEQSRGDYTVLLMDDDRIDSDFVECCIRAAKTRPEAGLIRTGTRVQDGDGRLIYNAPNLVADLDFTNFIIGWTEGKTGPFLCSTMFRTGAIQATGMHSRHNLWNDVITELRIASQHGRVDLPEIKASYSLHSGEVSSQVEIVQWCEDSIELLDTICALAPHDAPLLRSRLLPFLARLNYRNAVRLKKSWIARLAACRFVNTMFGGPPRPGELIMDAFKQTALFGLMRETKRALYSSRKQQAF